jgi:Toprim domain-containing protein
MSLSSDTPRDNLTLSEADLAACRPIVGEGGHVLRALCPFHGSDRQRSLRVQVHSGRFVCFACGAWGYMDTARTQWRAEQQRQAAFSKPAARRQRTSHHRQPPPRLSRPPAAARPRSSEPSASCASTPERPDLAQQLAAFQAALPGSRGAAYLQQRGIPLALAQQLGVGYATPGTWPHAARDWRGGRVVFPHTTPDGRLVNLYGRAVGTAEQVPKSKRHDHLPGAKGYFNATALQAGPGLLWVCEGAFDALALLAAGVSRVVAIFGVQGWLWEWAREVRDLVFALDADAAGQQQWHQLARQAALRGKRVAVLPAAAYGGCKDVSDAWATGVLAVGAGRAAAPGGEALAVPPHQRESWAERVAIMVIDGGLPHADAERLAWAGLQIPGVAS